MNTPAVTTIVMSIFLYVSLRVLSLTLEQNIPIKMTMSKFPDLNIMTAGKLVSIIASVDKTLASAMLSPHMNVFLVGRDGNYSLK